MEALLTVIALLAMIALGAFLIHRLNAQHRDRIAAFRYGRSGATAASPALTERERARGKAAARETGAHHGHRRGRGWLSLRHRTRRPTR